MSHLPISLQASGFKRLSGEVAWRSPSNIALVKYWGKYPVQLPANPSISFTLSNSFSETSISFSPNDSNDVSLNFSFEGKPNEQFSTKIHMFLKSLIPDFPFIKAFHLEIESSNSFPHSSGIASSASSMSAIALCLLSIYNQVAEVELTEDDFKKMASYIARLGSGSAGRSVYGGYTVWGKSAYFDGSNDEFAIPVGSDFNDVFKNLHDDILIVEKGAKAVSSSVGHGLMENHPYAEQRFKQASENMGKLKKIMQDGDLDLFGQLIENEALTLHSMMLTSTPSFILFKPNTLAIIERIRSFRKEKESPVFFTLDAGANVHLIYPDSISVEVTAFIKSELLVYCENAEYICDQIGQGPKQLK